MSSSVSPASAALDECRTPVLVGLGELTDRPDGPPPGSVAEFMARVLRVAAADAVGDAPGDGRSTPSPAAQAVLERAELIAVAPSASWADGDPGRGVATELGITPSTMRSSMVGGNGSQLLVNELAARIAAGSLDVALMCGAETLHSGTAQFEDFADAGPDPSRASDEVLEGESPGNSEAELAIGFALPTIGYALMEQAIGHDAGRTTGQQRHVAAELWSRFSAVAAERPNAWVRQPHSAADIETATPSNRQVTHPYTKLMVANFRIDEAAGLVVCSAAAARELGINEDRWVYIQAGAQANDEWFVSERAALHRSPAIAACGEALFAHAGITSADLGPVDLYSCFPSAVQISARELGLPIDDPERPLTETGGLTFFGGPGNNYGTHGVISVARKLREAAPGTVGLSSSLGWYATKHAIGLYGSSAAARPYETLRPTPAPNHVEVVSVEEAAAAGTLTVEVATAFYSRGGAPEFGMIFAQLPDGRRALGRTTDPALMDAIATDAFIGSSVRIDTERTAYAA